MTTGIVGGGGGPDLSQMLGLLSNPTELQARLEQYNKAKVEADQAVAKVAKAEDLVRLRDEAEAMRRAATKKLADAEAEAQRVVSDAKREASRLKQQVADESSFVMNEADVSRQAAQQELAAAIEKRQAAERLQVEVDAAREELNSREALVRMEGERLDKLQRVIDLRTLALQEATQSFMAVLRG